MPRKIIPLVTGESYHIFNRGVDKRDIFLDKSDYIRFYRCLEVFNSKKPAGNFRDSVNKERDVEDRLVKIVAYCLLPNHFHILLEQVSDNGVSNFMKKLQGGYTSYFNERHKRSGSLLQGRYKKILIDNDEYYNYLFAYVNENHYVHDIPRDDELYLSSSIHYQKIKTSKLIYQSMKYDQSSAVKLVKDIKNRREILMAEV